MKPNIFEIGTKELNQDAFITWLLQYANGSNSQDFSNDDKLLNSCGKEFIKLLISKVYPNEAIKNFNIVAGRQWEKIDVWAEIDNKYLIIIEDKTSSAQHSDQLKRYKQVAEKWCSEQTPKYAPPICIYLKTGNESISSLKKVEGEGFKIFNRLHFLELLSRYSEIKNQIFIDFYERLARMEKAVNQYEHKIIKNWEADDWVGFYQFLDSSVGLINWYKLNNPSGGFWNAIIDWPTWNGFPVQFQIEQGRIAFKISFDPEEIDHEDIKQFNIDEEQDKWQSILLEHASVKFPEIKKPSPYAHRGMWRTVAYIDITDWLGAPEALLNKENVVQLLLKYKQFILTVVNTKS